MEWIFHDDIPIYLQIIEQIKMQIALGHIKPGERLPSVREMAVEAGVNPNTMQKALSELEREGYVYTQRTSGRFVSENNKLSGILQKDIVLEYMQAFMEQMIRIGYTPKESADMYRQFTENQNITERKD